MQLSLISQILAENDYVQKLHVGHGAAPLVSSHKRIKKLAQELRRTSPATRSYCLAFTILSICAETEIDQLRYYCDHSGWDDHSRTKYVLSFERLQYQTNLAISLLA